MEGGKYTSYDKMLCKYAKIVDVNNPLEVEILDLLINRGAKVNYRTSLNENVLFEVIKDIETFKYFIGKDADITRRNDNKETILEVALSDGCYEVVKFCVDKLLEIKLKGHELDNITNILFYEKNRIDDKDKKSLFYNILDVVNDDCLELFFNSVNIKVLSNISVKLISNWNNVERLKSLNMPFIGHFYRDTSINNVDDFNNNGIFLKFEDENFNTFKRVLKYYAAKEEFFWYIENNYEGIKDKEIKFKFKNKSVSPIIYIFKSLKDYATSGEKSFLNESIEKVVFILKNNICKEVLDENIFNSFFEYSEKAFDEMRFISVKFDSNNMQTSLFNSFVLLSEMPNKVLNWDNVNSKKFIKNIMYYGNENEEFVCMRDKAILSFNMLKGETRELSDYKKVKI